MQDLRDLQGDLLMDHRDLQEDLLQQDLRDLQGYLLMDHRDLQEDLLQQDHLLVTQMEVQVRLKAKITIDLILR